jgi:hypothetical protein
METFSYRNCRYLVLSAARFKFFTVIKIKVVVLCSDLVGYLQFQVSYCLKMKATWFFETLVSCVTTQKTATLIFTVCLHTNLNVQVEGFNHCESFTPLRSKRV